MLTVLNALPTADKSMTADALAAATFDDGPDVAATPAMPARTCRATARSTRRPCSATAGTARPPEASHPRTSA
jgi:hypothetical protein